MGGECFTPGTKIRMADGSQKSIYDVEAGDQVKGAAGNNTVMSRPSFMLDINSLYGWKGREPWTTGMHPFMARDGWSCFEPALFADHWPGDYRAVADQNIGMEVHILEDGDYLYREEAMWEMVEDVEQLEERDDFTVYNLMLDGDHTFFANGYLVHNKGDGGMDAGDTEDEAAVAVAATATAAAEAATTGIDEDVANQAPTAPTADQAAAQGVDPGDDPGSAGVTGGAVSDDPDIGEAETPGFTDWSNQFSVNQAIARGAQSAAASSTIGLAHQGIVALSNAIGLGAHGTNEGSTDTAVGDDDGVGGAGGEDMGQKVNQAIRNPVVPPPSTSSEGGGGVTTAAARKGPAKPTTQAGGTSAATGADGGTLATKKTGDLADLDSDAVNLTARRARALASLRQGRRSTILTRGLSSEASTTFKTLLGQ